MQYKIETHMHTKEVSFCGQVNAQDMVDGYAKAGYSTLIITDHFRQDVITSVNGSDHDKIMHFISGYETAKKHAEQYGINVLLSAELTFNGQLNDFLLYGITTELMLANPYLYDFTPKELLNFANDNGIVIVQAHPYRGYCTVSKPQYIHGIEIINGNSNHNSQNDIANNFAIEHNLFKTAGSDSHEIQDIAATGMLSDTNITTMDEFITALKSGKLHTM